MALYLVTCGHQNGTLLSDMRTQNGTLLSDMRTQNGTLLYDMRTPKWHITS